MKNKTAFRVNTFFYYADEYRKKLTDETEIQKINLTELFYKELNEIIKAGELINININAPPTYGKSTCGMAIANELMKKHFKRKLNITDIDRDQQEFSRTMRNPNITHTIRVIDEWNTLETQGENSTAEQGLYDYFSDVMAQRFVHKISCSPKDAPDKNALIYLEVISMDKTRKINHCRLFYKIFNAGTEQLQLIGYVDIDVNEILKEQWYKEYRRRKFKKMDLILKEGIFQPRKLEYAEIIMETIRKLKPLTKMPTLLTPNIVRNYIKMEGRRTKTPQSIVGEELAVREALGILELYKNYYKISKTIETIHRLEIEGKIKEEQAKEEIEELELIRKEIINAEKTQEEELERYKKIYHNNKEIIEEVVESETKENKRLKSLLLRKNSFSPNANQ